MCMIKFIEGFEFDHNVQNFIPSSEVIKLTEFLC